MWEISLLDSFFTGMLLLVKYSYPLFVVYFVIYMILISIKNKEKSTKWRKERFIKHASIFLMGFSLLFISMIVSGIGKVLIHYKFFEFVLAMCLLALSLIALDVISVDKNFFRSQLSKAITFLTGISIASVIGVTGLDFYVYVQALVYDSDFNSIKNIATFLTGFALVMFIVSCIAYLIVIKIKREKIWTKILGVLMSIMGLAVMMGVFSQVDGLVEDLIEKIISGVG